MSVSDVSHHDSVIDLNYIEEIIDDYNKNPEDLIMIMQASQKKYRYLPEVVLYYISSTLGIPINKIYEISTFYSSFSLKPLGKYIVNICTGTACHIKGSNKIVENICGRFGINTGNTTSDGKFTIQTVNCVGACAVAPVTVVDEKYYPRSDIKKLNSVIDKLDIDAKE